MHLLSRHPRPFLFLLSCALLGSIPACLPAQTTQPDTYNTTLFGALDPQPPSNSTERYSALWGYTAPDGREYALLGGYTGTHIIDITEKPITEVAFIPGPHSGWREMKTFGHYAYVVNETGQGLQIIDLADLPNSATLVKSDSSVFSKGHTITQEGKFLYVNGSNVEAGVNQGVLIFNVANDPLNPELVGSYAKNYAHDVAVRNDTMYVSAILDGKLDIVALGPDRTEPKFVTDIIYPGAGTHNSDLTSGGGYVMTTDEVGATAKTLKVWEIADRENITQVAEWTPAPLDIIHNVHIAGNLAYISWYTAGTRIADISDPAHPVQIAYFDADLSGQVMAYAGNWEVYPYFQSGKVIASYMESGLYVFTLDSDRKASVHGIVRDAVTGDPLPGAIISVPKQNVTITADAQGAYEISGGAGQLDFTATVLNYLLETGTITLTEDNREQDILITPLELRTVTLVPVDQAVNQLIPSFSYNLLTRSEGNVGAGEPLALVLPSDSAYTIMVGAWGYSTAEVTLPIGAAGEITVPLRKGYADNAEVDLGWSTSAPSDDAVAGTWQRFALRSGFFLQLPNGSLVTLVPEEDRTSGAGDKAFATVNRSYHIDSGTTTLTSPTFDLTDYNNPVLAFDLWYTNSALFWLPIDDKAYISVSNDGGESWTVLEELTKATNEWERKSYELNKALEVTDRMLFRLVAADSNTQEWVTAALDSFEITEGPSSSVGTPGVQDSTSRSTLALFPNPLTGNGALEVNLNAKQSAVRIDLLDGLGRQVSTLYRGEMNEGHTRIPVQSAPLAPGFYILRFVADDGSARYLPTTVVR